MSSGSEEYLWDTDGRIEYSSGWQLTEIPCDETCEEGTFHSTTTRGATASLSFLGSQVTVNGYIFPGDATVSAKYSIDGGESETRTEASNSGGQVYLSTDLFTSDALPLAQHSIRVEVDGTSSSRNYSIVYFLVNSNDQGVVASSFSSSTSSGGTSSSMTSNGPLAGAATTGPTTSTSADATITSAAPNDTSTGTTFTGSGPSAIATSSSSVSFNESSSSTQANSDTDGEGVPVGVLLGGILGGLGLVAIIALICYLFYRDKRKRRTGLANNDLSDVPSRGPPSRERHDAIYPFIISEILTSPDHTSPTMHDISPKGNPYPAWRGVESTEQTVSSGPIDPPAYTSLRYYQD
ncbi:hypothetical protein A7U60_g1236 [Sanghuangporus baumii]|uniref:Mid2 domain-containing protein n=1 Tax=Sanghuangporus baumii TaxID=108892 RepID=A0A9Q5NBV3_SANBA|nr:hypothetical protein A7U60_g1236 [Sanghuangporus baumii]